MEDLLVMWKKLSLSEEEESEYSDQVFETTGGEGFSSQILYT